MSRGTERLGRPWSDRLTPGVITGLVLAALAVVFIVENRHLVQIRVIIPLVTLPLWAALAAMLVIGAAIGLLIRRSPRSRR